MRTPIFAVCTLLLAVSPAIARDMKDSIAIRKILDDGCKGFVGRDIDAAMAPYSKQLYIFDIAPPQHGTYDSLRANNLALLNMAATSPTCNYQDMFIKVYGDNAYAHYVLPFAITLKSGQKLDIEGRGTDIFEKSHGTWLIVHEHLSVPANPLSGEAELKPAK